MTQLKLLLLAVGFYTRLPVPALQNYSQLPQSTVYLPLVGWIIGALTALSCYLADYLWPTPVGVILALIVGILLTGAFHEDGFADVCDGFGGGYNKTRILAIMKDSYIGVYGTVGLLLLFALKISLLSAQGNSAPLFLLVGHSISRLPPLLLMRQYDYTRIDNSKVAAAVYKPNGQDLVFTSAIALLPLALLPSLCLLALVPVIIINTLLGHYFYRHIGGYTGDCLGASQQVAEVVFYLSASTLWTFI
ncbi:adenosylcobinamide-GDP ribazoletransferase [Crenothrix sp.]|uniref:adenosylcobinamide-GDP ribazoletransferase n=1 Tax=Crenothrix sp. TaxID=3100433 RepID=UPI00374D2D0A